MTSKTQLGKKRKEVTKFGKAYKTSSKYVYSPIVTLSSVFTCIIVLEIENELTENHRVKKILHVTLACNCFDINLS